MSQSIWSPLAFAAVTTFIFACIVYQSWNVDVAAPPYCDNGWCKYRSDQCYYRHNRTCYAIDHLEAHRLLMIGRLRTIRAIKACESTMALSLKVPRDEIHVCLILQSYCEITRDAWRGGIDIGEEDRLLCRDFSLETCENFHLCVQ